MGRRRKLPQTRPIPHRIRLRLAPLLHPQAEVPRVVGNPTTRPEYSRDSVERLGGILRQRHLQRALLPPHPRKTAGPQGLPKLDRPEGPLGVLRRGERMPLRDLLDPRKTPGPAQPPDEIIERYCQLLVSYCEAERRHDAVSVRPHFVVVRSLLTERCRWERTSS